MFESCTNFFAAFNIYQRHIKKVNILNEQINIIKKDKIRDDVCSIFVTTFRDEIHKFHHNN